MVRSTARSATARFGDGRRQSQGGNQAKQTDDTVHGELLRGEEKRFCNPIIVIRCKAINQPNFSILSNLFILRIMTCTALLPRTIRTTLSIFLDLTMPCGMAFVPPMFSFANGIAWLWIACAG